MNTPNYSSHGRTRSAHSNRYHYYINESEAWQRVRDLIYARSGGYCEWCGKVLHGRFCGHHLHYRYLFFEATDDTTLASVVCICHECHQQAHPERGISWAELVRRVNAL